MNRSIRVISTAALVFGLSATTLPHASAQDNYTPAQALSGELLNAGSSWLLAPGNPVGGSVVGSSSAFFCVIEKIIGTDQQAERACG